MGMGQSSTFGRIGKHKNSGNLREKRGQIGLLWGRGGNDGHTRLLLGPPKWAHHHKQCFWQRQNNCRGKKQEIKKGTLRHRERKRIKLAQTKQFRVTFVPIKRKTDSFFRESAE
jgi:hypothetical protein